MLNLLDGEPPVPTVARPRERMDERRLAAAPVSVRAAARVMEDVLASLA